MDDEKTALLGELHRYRTALEQAQQHIRTCQYRHTHWCDEHSDVERIVQEALAEPSAVTGAEDEPVTGGDYLDERWSLDPGYAYVKHGAYVWVFAGERKQYESYSVGPTSICQTTPDIAQRIVSDHNAALAPRPEGA